MSSDEISFTILKRKKKKKKRILLINSVINMYTRNDRVRRKQMYCIYTSNNSYFSRFFTVFLKLSFASLSNSSWRERL